MTYQASGPLPTDLPGGVDLDRAVARLGEGADPTAVQEALSGVIGFFVSTYKRRLYPIPASDSDDPVVLGLTLKHRRHRLRLPDARLITTVAVRGEQLDDSEWEVEEQNGLGVRLVLHRRLWGPVDLWWPVDHPHETIPVQVTGRFGFTEVPSDLADAFYAHAARNYREKDAAYADQVDYSDQGGGVASYFRTMSNRVKAVYGSYTVATDLLGLE